MKRTTKRILQLTLALALAVSTMLVAIPIASAKQVETGGPYYNLSLSMTVDKATAAPGETVKYLITITNNSDLQVSGVKFSGTAKLVNGFTPVLTMPTQTLDFGDFTPGQSKSMTYTQVIPSTATNGQFFDNFGYATGYGILPSPALLVSNDETPPVTHVDTIPITSNDASARTTIKVIIPDPTVPAGDVDNDGTLVVTGEAEAAILPIFLGSMLLICGIFMVVKSRREAE